MPVDCAQVIFEAVTRAGTTFASHAASAHVYGFDVPESWGDDDPGVVFEIAAESPYFAGDAVEVAVAFKCYGGIATGQKLSKHAAARAVFLALRGALNGAKGLALTSGRVIVCEEESGGHGARENDTGLAVCRAKYRMVITGN